MRITFFIDAPSNFLCEWLEDFTWDAPYKFFPIEKGRIIVQRASPWRRGNKLYMRMEGMYVTSQDSNTEMAYPISDVIEFKIIPLTSSRIEIAAECNQPVATEYFLYLLTEMNKRWPQPEDVKVELLQIKKTFEAGLSDIKLGQAAIYSRIGELDRKALNQILEAVRQGRIEQGETERVLDAIRRTLKYIQVAGLPTDAEVKKTLDDVYQSVNSDLNSHQQLELSLPVIPFLLEYKIGIDAGVDLGALWKELVQRAQKNQDKM